MFYFFFQVTGSLFYAVDITIPLYLLAPTSTFQSIVQEMFKYYETICNQIVNWRTCYGLEFLWTLPFHLTWLKIVYNEWNIHHRSKYEVNTANVLGLVREQTDSSTLVVTLTLDLGLPKIIYAPLSRIYTISQCLSLCGLGFEGVCEMTDRQIDKQTG